MFRLETVTPIFSFSIGGLPIDITRDIVVQWGVMLCLFIASLLLTRNLKRKPNKVQVVIESVYSYVEGLVKQNMGESYIKFIPYVGTLVVYLLTLNLIGLIGLKPPTQNLSVTAGLALTSFVVINFTAIKRNGILGYSKGFAQPYAIMLPINIMERVVLPVSLALRLFGNMLAATMLIEMVYNGLEGLTWIAQIGLPIFVHGYFDLFDGTIQMLVFTMLTIINIKVTSEHH